MHDFEWRKLYDMTVFLNSGVFLRSFVDLPFHSLYNKERKHPQQADGEPPEVSMTDKELRKAKKDDLIEMLYYLRKEVDELKEQNDALRAKVLLLSGEETDRQGEADA